MANVMPECKLGWRTHVPWWLGARLGPARHATTQITKARNRIKLEKSQQWGIINGFTDALTLPNVFPRYFHFITACLAITGLFLAFWFGTVMDLPVFEKLKKSKKP